MIQFIFGMFIGILIGLPLFVLFIFPRSSGCLRIDRSDPDDEPLLFLELSKNVQDIEHKDCVLLKIKAENYIPRK